MANKEKLSLVNAKVAFTSECNLECMYCEGKRGFCLGKPAAMEDFRRKPLEGGNISSDILIRILGELYNAGLRGISPTGGEPMLREDWDDLVREIALIGYDRVELTTNGLLLESYLEKEGCLPKGLTLVKVSLDTHDPVRFKTITRGGSLEKVVRGVSAISDQVYTRANRVLLRSELNQLVPYVDFCRGLGLKEASFLDLVCYTNRDREKEIAYFIKEFVGYPEFSQIFKKSFGVEMIPMEKWGVLFHQAMLPDGFKITFKDSRITRRANQCDECTVFCQEGICLIRIGTDGNLTLCPDYRADLPSYDTQGLLKEGSLPDKIKTIAEVFASSRQIRTIELFAQKHGILLPKTD